MAKLSNWRKILKMPVISEYHDVWNHLELRDLLKSYADLCLKQNFLANNGRICQMLSGGVDSSLNLALNRRIVGQYTILHTFTTAVSENHPDIIIARKVSEQFNTVRHELILNTSSIENAKIEMKLLWPDEEFSPGDVAVFLTYRFIHSLGFKAVIAHNGINELMGGYWKHRESKNHQEQENVFRSLWVQLSEKHLLPLERKAGHFGIKVLFPYLQTGIVDYISKIPVWERTRKEKSKIPLKMIALLYLPKEVVNR